MKITDAHIHYLPECFSEENILSSMDRLGIEKSLVLATPDHPRYTQMSLTGTNEQVLALCKRNPGRLIPSLYVEPRNVMEAQTMIRRFYDGGGRFLKMWPGHGYSPDDPMIYPVWETVNELKMAVTLHMGSLGVRTKTRDVNRSSGFNAKYGQPILLDAPGRYFPDIQFIIAHTAYPWSLEALEMAFMFPNIWIDFSCDLGFEAWNLIDKLRPARIAWNKFMFGSDTAGSAVEYVEKWNKIAEEELFAPHAENFFHGNFETLCKLIEN